MSQGMAEAAGAGSSGVEHDSWRAVVMACGLAAAAVCAGGLSAIVAVSQGASAVVSLSLMAAFVFCGAVGATVMVHRARREESEQAPETLLEKQLSARYGVPVQRLAWHVWRIDGELVEANLDPSTGYLTSGGRELRL